MWGVARASCSGSMVHKTLNPIVVLFSAIRVSRPGKSDIADSGLTDTGHPLAGDVVGHDGRVALKNSHQQPSLLCGEIGRLDTHGGEWVDAQFGAGQDVAGGD